MGVYRGTGSTKGAQIQNVLTGLGYQNINDVSRALQCSVQGVETTEGGMTMSIIIGENIPMPKRAPFVRRRVENTPNFDNFEVGDSFMVPIADTTRECIPVA